MFKRMLMKILSTRALSVVCIVVFLALVITVLSDIKTKDTTDTIEPTLGTPLRLEVENYLNDSRMNIFLMETTNKTKKFTLKQLCAIESAAKHNPNALVLIATLVRKNNLNDLKKKYGNIHDFVLNLDETFTNTPLQKWWFGNQLSNKNWYFRASHLSDALRYLLVYRYGGFYFDMDTITLKDLEPLSKYNGFTATNEDPKIMVGSGFFHFYKNHPLLLQAVKNFSTYYNASIWGSVGPLLARDVTMRYCGVKNLDELMHLGIERPIANFDTKKTIKNLRAFGFTKAPKPHPCKITVFPPYISYPYDPFENPQFISHNDKLHIYRLLHSYSFHSFNFLTDSDKLLWNENSVHEYLASVNCPITHSKWERSGNATKNIQ